MNILLCTPFNSNQLVTQGGISIWAQNVVDYYRSLETDIKLQIVAYERRDGFRTWLPKRVWNAFKDYLSPIKKTKEQLINEKYDVLHLCTSASLSLIKDIIVLRIARRKGVKTTIHFHFGRIPELSKHHNWEWRLLQRVIRLADAAIIMDMKSYKLLHDCGFNNVHYLPNPLSRSIIQQVEQDSHSIKKETRKLCFVGHVIPTKGVFELVEACKRIEKIHLHIFGKVAKEVRERMSNLACNGSWLIFEGEVDHQRVIRELLSTSIFVLPTYTEGFPNVILESMACGCAIVTTPVGAIPEMLDLNSEMPCGLCSSPRDVEGLYRNIRFFLDHPEEARNYSERAVNRVNEVYVVGKIWLKLEEIWKGLIYNES